MLSRRFPADMSPSAFSLRTTALRKGREVIDLTVSSPLHAGLECDVDQALHSVAKQTFWRAGTASAQGPQSVRESIAAYLSGLHRVAHCAQNVWITASTSEAYATLFRMFCNPGDSILVPVPGYPLLDALAGLDALHCHPYFLRETAQGWEIDLQSLESLPERTRILVVVAPHNPCGHIPSAQQWLALEQFCVEQQLVLVVDEVFAAYSQEPRAPLLIPAAPRIPVFRLDGLSKSVGLPQIKVGWIYAHLPADQRQEMENALEYILDASLSVSGLSAALCAPLLEQAQAFQNLVQERLQINRQALRTLLPASVHIPACSAGWYQCIRLPGCEDEAFCLTLLEHRGVLVQPGFFFDFSADDWIVLSLLTAPELFRAGLTRLAEFCAENQRV